MATVNNIKSLVGKRCPVLSWALKSDQGKKLQPEVGADPHFGGQLNFPLMLLFMDMQRHVLEIRCIM